jgi:hypothetical protein
MSPHVSCFMFGRMNKRQGASLLPLMQGRYRSSMSTTVENISEKIMIGENRKDDQSCIESATLQNYHISRCLLTVNGMM